MAATFPFREALSEGIASGTFVDTKIILFSRKDTSGRVHGPKELYASSHVLRCVPHFSLLLFGNFMEAGPQNFGDTFDDGESSYDYGYCSDSDLEDDNETAADVLKGVLKRAVPPKDTMKEALRKVTPQQGTLKRVLRSGSLRSLRGGSLRRPPHEKYSERSYKGKVIKIPDMAFITFQAFLLYLYTGEMEFAPMKSGGNQTWGIGLRDSLHDDVPRPSPRSIYRLADKYDVPALRRLALCRIREELHKRDIVKETFSKFASKYEEVRKEYVAHLTHTLVNDTTKQIWPRVSAIIDRHSRGDLEHVTEALSLLWNSANQRGSIIASPISQPSWRPPPIEHPTYWKVIRAAMVRSITQGVFFDQKYWTRHSKDGRVLRPIYFSKLIAGDALRACISDGQATAKYSGREIEDESDCESDDEEAGEFPSALQQDSRWEEHGQARAVLIPGSFGAWKSLFFYLCTDEISFAPLKSQGADFRLAYILGTTPDGPPPCSPKSIYCLARLLDIRHLKALSLGDIESKLSEDNIVEELASHVSSTYEEVREMEYRLFFSRFQSPATVHRMQEQFAGVCATRSAHQADVLKLGLQSALDLMKRDNVAGRGDVMLRCKEGDCPGNRSYTSYSLEGVLTNEFCQPCFKIGRQRYLICTGCGYERTDRDIRCQHCRKKFGLVVSFPGQ